ncbi:MAG: N-acetyltransferase [Acidimicrobiales bacterium]
MKLTSGAPAWLAAFTASERPDLWALARDERPFESLWPEYNHHGNHTGEYFGSLVPDRADFQVLFVDRRSDRLIARARTIPFRWDGTLADLPAGIDALGLKAVGERDTHTALSALAAEVVADYQGKDLSRLVVQSMRALAQRHDLHSLVAPVRPSWKDRYPLIPIDQYAEWRRQDGLPFDPWLRVHARLGGRVLRSEPRSLQITAPVQDWQRWTEMVFPEDGDYVFPSGLAPLRVEAGIGYYWEPNVWVVHDV